MKIFSSALFAFSVFGLSACGFSPVYSGYNESETGPIHIIEIDGRAGYAVRQELNRLLRPGLPGVPEGAQLDIIIEEELVRLAFQQDGAAVRNSTIMHARYVLSYGETAISGTADARSDVASPQAGYADVAAQIQAQERAALSLAADIYRDIQLQVNRNP